MKRYALIKKGLDFLVPIAVLIGGLLLASCSVKNQQAAILESVDVDPSIKEAFLSNDFIPSNWLSENWWEMFQDPQLNEFVETSLRENPSIQATFEQVSLAHDVAKQKFSPILPTVDADFQEMLLAFNWKREALQVDEPLIPNNILPNWINILAYMLKFKWTLDIWGKQTRLYKAAIDDTKAQMAEAAYSKLVLSIEVASAYITLQYNMRMRELQDENVQVHQELLGLSEQLMQNALYTKIDLKEAKKKWITSKIDLFSTYQNIVNGGHQLKVYMGKSPDDPEGITMPTASYHFPFPFPDNVPLDLLARRPDVVTKIWSIQAAIKRVNSAKVAFFPSINLASYSGFFDLTYKEIMKPRAWFTSVLPGASLPLFHGLKLRANLRFNLRNYNLAVYEYNETLLLAAKEVTDCITAFQIANLNLSAHEERLAGSYEIYELYSIKYQHALSTYLDVLRAKIAYLKDEMTHVQLLQTRLLAILNLIKSLGGGYNDPSAQVNMLEDFIYE